MENISLLLTNNKQKIFTVGKFLVNYLFNLWVTKFIGVFA